MKRMYSRIKHAASVVPRFEVVFLIVTLLTVAMVLSPLLRHHGWPENHESLSFVLRTEMYADHFRQGDLFPIWSQDDAYGMGTPLPLFYQKTFYYVSGFALLLANNVKLAIVATIALFMLVGIYGMRFASSKLTKNRAAIMAASLGFVLTNYSFTDWLVRGAMAEFAALMLVPWLIWWCLILLIDRRFSLTIIPILFLLLNAHNITGIFSLILLVLSYAIFLIKAKRREVISTLKRGAIAVLCLGALMLPMLFTQKIFLQSYDPSKITQAGYKATDNYVAFSQYLYHPQYTWLKDWMPFTTQIDFAIWIPVVVLGIVVSALYLRRKRLIRHDMSLTDSGRVLLFLIISLVLFIILQLRISQPVFTTFSILQFLQFPWRLLMYITPLGLLLVVWLVDTLKLRTRQKEAIMALILAGLLIASPILYHFQYQFIPIPEYKFTQSSNLGNALLGVGEYLPRVYVRGNQMGALDTLNLYSALAAQGTQSQGAEPSCDVKGVQADHHEPLILRFVVRCTKPARAILPISYNDYIVITDTTQHKVIPYTRLDRSDPRIVLNFPRTGKTDITVELPTVQTVLKKLI